MPKFVRFFLFATSFIIGISVGTYLGIKKEINITEENPTSITPLQDVVIRNVQEDNKVETLNEETKLSPYAKMVIEKKFNKCGHTTVNITKLPVELINMTESEVLDKYNDWEMRSFSSNELSLYREIDAYCNDHFVIKEKDGHLAIYTIVTDDVMNLKEETDIDITLLPSGEIEDLKYGIYVFGEEALNSMLEGFEI